MRVSVFHVVGIICLSIVSLVPCVQADSLLFDNSSYVGYVFPQNPVSYTEMLDYGTTTGGRISKFVFGYASASPGTVWIRFYRYTDKFDIGYEIRQFAVASVPSTYGYVDTYEYVIPEEQRFELTGGKFGYSFEFSNSSTQIALATGGTGIDRYFWMYDDFFDDFMLSDFGVGYNFYFQIYTAPPIDEVTCDITGAKFNDMDGDGIRDAGEPALPGWEFYLDINGDGAYQVSEPNAVTDPNGYYMFENMASPAVYTVREMAKDGWTQTLPGAGANYKYVLATEPNNVYAGYDFGNTTLSVKYGGGAGTQADPYQIRTAEQMNQIGLNPDDWSKYFILMADLDLSGLTGTSYTIIGYHNSPTVYKHFTGSFNGNNHVISNFSYTTAEVKKYVGLFGYAEGAQIHHLKLADVKVSSAGWYIGGLVGYQDGGSITQCSVTGQVAGGSASRYVGGLAGQLLNTTVNSCRSATDVSSGASSIYIGGFAGRVSNMTHCYSVGAVNGGTGSTNVGGLVGLGGTLTNCYWDTQTSGQAGGGGTPKTTTQMRAAATYTGWDFAATWRICEGMNYPRLKWEPVPGADFVCPEGVETADVVVMANAWLMAGALEADIAPAAPDGRVDLQDFAALSGQWMEETD